MRNACTLRLPQLLGSMIDRIMAGPASIWASLRDPKYHGSTWACESITDTQTPALPLIFTHDHSDILDYPHLQQQAALPDDVGCELCCSMHAGSLCAAAQSLHFQQQRQKPSGSMAPVHQSGRMTLASFSARRRPLGRYCEQIQCEGCLSGSAIECQRQQHHQLRCSLLLPAALLTTCSTSRGINNGFAHTMPGRLF